MGIAAALGDRMKRLVSGFLMAASLQAATYYVTVAGLGGEADYDVRFTSWAKEIDKLLKSAGAEVKATTLSGSNATRAGVTGVLNEIAKTAGPQDVLVLMLIGHGTFDGVEYKFNLPGPDISGTELAALLDRVKTQRQLVVNMTSASGGSLAALKKEGRAVIMATKTGTEKNAVVFPRYWIEAMRDSASDTDKNEVISALEAFRYAEQKTARFYETQKRIATEHPQLEDTGKGDAVKTPSPENGEGLLAAKFPLLRIGAAQAAAKDPKKQALLQKKEQLEQQIDQLKYQRAAMPSDSYRQQLAKLLLELAQVQEELDKP